tara:strand:- start:477 stop:968 length:492 start_codon:yes stop_codon:yes gene_type:complete
MINAPHKVSEDEKEVCNICHCSLPIGSVFCSYCDPPEKPVAILESRLSFSQTFLRIGFLLVLFAVFVFFKTDALLNEVMKEKSLLDGSTTSAEKPEDNSFKVIHFINSKMANIRARPVSGKIIMVLKRGERVLVEDRERQWSRIVAHGKTGWISDKLLDSIVE